MQENRPASELHDALKAQQPDSDFLKPVLDDDIKLAMRAVQRDRIKAETERVRMVRRQPPKKQSAATQRAVQRYHEEL